MFLILLTIFWNRHLNLQCHPTHWTKKNALFAQVLQRATTVSNTVAADQNFPDDGSLDRCLHAVVPS